MTVLFSQNKNYHLTLSMQEFERRLNAISSSNSLTGTFNVDGSFLLKLTSPLAIVDKGGVAYLSRLKGQFISEANTTVVRTRVLPNSFLLIILYVIFALLIFKLAGLNVFPNNSSWETYVGLTLFLALFYFLIVFSCRRLRNKFEKLFNLKPVD